MDWILSALVLSGNFLLGRKNKIGWWILAINSLAWIYYAYSLAPIQWGLMPSAAINFFLCLHGIYKWREVKGVE
jgi:hypothetical protein